MRHSFTLIFYDGRKVCVGPEGVGRARHVRKRDGRKVSLVLRFVRTRTSGKWQRSRMIDRTWPEEGL